MPETGTITVNLWDGAQQAFGTVNNALITVRDGSAKVRGSFFERASQIRIRLDVHENLDDTFAVIASSKGCSDAGFYPVPIRAGVDIGVDLMLAPRRPVFNFARASWQSIQAGWPDLYQFLSGSPGAQDNFENLRESRDAGCVACLLNIAAALRCLSDRLGENLLAKFRRVQLSPRVDRTKTEGLQQDRFFAWAEPGLMKFVIANSTEKVPEVATAEPLVFLKLLHGADADASYKEIRFGEANLQFTFHSNEPDPTGQGLIKVEMDIDYYKDALAHIALEVIPNAFEQGVKIFGPGLTNPAVVYVLRWMAGKRLNEKVPFDPLYTLQGS